MPLEVSQEPYVSVWIFSAFRCVGYTTAPSIHLAKGIPSLLEVLLGWLRDSDLKLLRSFRNS
jgi:hypothetical protein